jgi:hypothetical protein
MPAALFSVEDLDERFAAHPLEVEGAAERVESVRAGARALAEKVARVCPPGRELALALTALEEASFWANAAIARDPWSRPARASIR